jgi:hypothetical protein
MEILGNGQHNSIFNDAVFCLPQKDFRIRDKEIWEIV